MMRKVAASIVFPVSSPPRKNAVVEIDRYGTVVSVSCGGLSFKEIAGVEYYSGFLVPGLADVMCSPNESGHSLLAGGVRVAGRVGWPEDSDGSYGPPRQMVPDTTGVTWRNGYGGAVGYTLYNSMDHFSQFFSESEINDILLFSAPEGELEVLASHWRTDKGRTDRSGADRSGADQTGADRARISRTRTSRAQISLAGNDRLRTSRESSGLIQVNPGLTGLLGIMLTLQDAPPHYSFPKLLTMATLNGVLASGYRGEAGCLLPGMRPGLNIIEGVDIGKMRLLPVSRIRQIC